MDIDVMSNSKAVDMITPTDWGIRTFLYTAILEKILAPACGCWFACLYPGTSGEEKDHACAMAMSTWEEAHCIYQWDMHLSGWSKHHEIGSQAVHVHAC